MKKLIIVLVICISNVLYAQKEESDNRFSVNKNKPARQEWLRDLGFGMFIHDEGNFTLQLPQAEKGKEYQYRAVVVHPRLTVRGDVKRIVVK